MNKEKLIITGSGGTIGKILCTHFNSEYEIIEMDKNIGDEQNCYKVDISDFEALSAVFKQTGDVKCVIHLAGTGKPTASWSNVLHNNIIGTHNIYECARLFDIPKIIPASSCHTTGGCEEFSSIRKPGPFFKKITVGAPVKPNSDYATSKVYVEAIARQYYEQYGVQSICIRIGYVSDADECKSGYGPEYLNIIWLSHRDLIQLYEKSLKSNIEFGIYYGTSKNQERIFDPQKSGKKLGLGQRMVCLKVFTSFKLKKYVSTFYYYKILLPR